MADGTCAPGYARDRMSAVKSFVRWLWEQEALENLPKNINSKELNIVKRLKTPETFSLPEVTPVLRVSSGRSRLYVLLGLNCGMTQKEISDLQKDDVSWKNSTITRKRNKTRRYEGVPVVTYKVWPETLELLREHRSDSESLLLNRNGSPLVEERLDADGKYRKSDNIKNAYERVLRKASIAKPFKLLRKTSATLINEHDQFRGLDQLFLGHAPSTIAARHYSATSETALDGALDFLRIKYEIEKIDIDVEPC
jgi:integrase